MKKIKRIYHHCDKLEEAMMWGTCKPSEKEMLIENSYDLLTSPEDFLNACRDVLIQWPYSSEHNLSERAQNRQAWIGWAACCVNHDSTEYTTRNAWRHLTEQQKETANYIAQQIIEEWEQCQR